MGVALQQQPPPRRRVRRATGALDISLIVTTYERPRHLERCLESIAMQQGVNGRFEVVVTDDGSTDDTPQIVDAFSRRVHFPVTFITRPHEDFQVGRCRNHGVAASRAPYLQFVDGDCVLPPDTIGKQLKKRRPRTCWSGFYLQVGQEDSEQTTIDSVRTGDYLRYLHPRLRRSRRDLFIRHVKSQFYRLTFHPNKPRLIGGNASLWRTDFEAVNGYDEGFVGWGCEDDDLGCRLRRRGVRILSNLNWMQSYHLWHPRTTSFPTTWRENPNVDYLERKGQLTRCRLGLRRRRWQDLGVQLVGAPDAHPLLESLLRRLAPPIQRRANSEIELLFAPGAGKFSGRAECNLLVALKDGPAARRAAKKAHVVISDLDLGSQSAATFELAEIDRALDSVG